MYMYVLQFQNHKPDTVLFSDNHLMCSGKFFLNRNPLSDIHVGIAGYISGCVQNLTTNFIFDVYFITDESTSHTW